MARQVPAIGIFDSGVGGLSIYQAVRTRLPGARYFYCSDTLNYPYGTKTADEVIDCTYKGTTAFIKKYDLDVLIIACNTASTVALPQVRARLAIPVIGVVPAIKPAAVLSVSRVIGLLATPATVKRAYTDELIRNFAADCQVVRVGSSLLVELAERYMRGETIADADIAKELAPLFTSDPADRDGAKLDVVVLGCTHFPLLRAFLTRLAPWPVQWLDSGEAIAARTEVLLGETANMLKSGSIAPYSGVDGKAVFTKMGRETDAMRPALRRFGFEELEKL